MGDHVNDTDDQNQVAIIGMAGRFPRAADVDTLWNNLQAGVEGISTFSADELRDAGVSEALLAQPGYVRAKGVLEGADQFDAGFFGLSPREAEIMDPQHRVFLECAWEALETAGYDPQAFTGRIGVFAGASMNTYLLMNLISNRRAIEAFGPYQTQLASDKDFLATRASYKLGLKGPSVTIQTACSTSLVAVHMACQSVLGGECDIALAGGVSINVPLRNGYLHETGGILSPDGHCRAFDARAGGTVISNGVALVVLRRLRDAREHGDVIDAVIRGSAINNDGSLKVGYTAPSVEGQAEVIAEALGIAGVEPDTVGYVETHGTGTALGDPIEIAALTRAFRERTQRRGFCAIGSIKTNLGHLDAAAGATGLIKAALALRHKAIPPSLHFERPNPELALDTSPFFVNALHRAWDRDGAPRRAGVSSFGIGGTNVHVVLEEAPPAPPGGPSRPWHVLPISARSAGALAPAAERLADHLERHPELDLADVGFTLASCRRGFELRRAITCSDHATAIAQLRSDARAAAPRPAARDPAVAFLFPGQGTQYPAMARGLYEQEPVFRAELDRCLALFDGQVDGDLRGALFPATGDEARAAERLAQTALTQPALFAVEHALARTWMAWGVQPRAMIGHSIGEWVAACLAGVFTLEDAARLVAARGRLVQAMPAGAMLAVLAPEVEVQRYLTCPLDLAAVNAPAMCVVSGPGDAIDELERELGRRGTGTRRLRTSHAFHSAMMEPAAARFVDEVRRVRREPPQIPWCSNVTGRWIAAGEATSPEYWGAHLRQTVRFADGLSALLADPGVVVLEVGPGRSLTTFAGQHPAWSPERTAVCSVRHPGDARADGKVLAEALGAVWSAGASVDWAAYHAGETRRRLRLPTYPFQRQRYWIDSATAPAPSAAPTGRTSDPADWTYVASWHRMPPARIARSADAVRWLVLGAELPLGRALADRLERDGDTVVRVAAGATLAETGPRDWTIDPARRDHHAHLLDALRGGGAAPSRVVHLWSLDGEPGPALDDAVLDRAQARGLHSLLALGQALAEVRDRGAVAIDVVCQGVFAVTGDEPLHPERATLLGPCTVMPQELPGIACRLLDVGALPGEAVDAVLAALRAPATERVAALRGSHWWARRFEPLPLDAAPAGASRLRDRGVYLITGGLGGIGLALAEHIARSAVSPVLALLGRSAFPPEDAWPAWLAAHGGADPTSARIRALQRLQALGARPVVLQADVASSEQTTRVLEELRRQFGPIHGVIHAA
ncbi:MAG TPA: type I polyketide synthase, partial [Kofleriaceae bacterium]|nr:type I polyketide synthase [Kofleriaceae bacterium]